MKTKAADFDRKFADSEDITAYLDLMAQATPLGEIADQLATRFPSRFSTPQQALSHVGELSLKYARD